MYAHGVSGLSCFGPSGLVSATLRPVNGHRCDENAQMRLRCLGRHTCTCILYTSTGACAHLCLHACVCASVASYSGMFACACLYLCVCVYQCVATWQAYYKILGDQAFKMPLNGQDHGDTLRIPLCVRRPRSIRCHAAGRVVDLCVSRGSGLGCSERPEGRGELYDLALYDRDIMTEHPTRTLRYNPLNCRLTLWANQPRSPPALTTGFSSLRINDRVSASQQSWCSAYGMLRRLVSVVHRRASCGRWP